MTREEAEDILKAAGKAGDGDFPLLEAAIACAEHDLPFRDPEPARLLGRAAAEHVAATQPSPSPPGSSATYSGFSPC